MNAKRTMVLLGLTLWLLPFGRLFASDTVRMDSIASKAEQANEGVRNMQSKIDDLQMKINRLEDKISSRDYRIETLERKLRDQDILDRRVRALEEAREESRLSKQTKAKAQA